MKYRLPRGYRSTPGITATWHSGVLGLGVFFETWKYCDPEDFSRVGRALGIKAVVIYGVFNIHIYFKPRKEIQ